MIESDDDEEDIGKDMNRKLEFDSDEEEADETQNELIDLNKPAAGSKPVPKLRKPK